MNSYELMLLFDPGLGEEKIGTVVSRMEDRIRNLGGELGKTDKWGVRRLASTISRAKKLKQAYYVVVYFKADPSVPGQLQNFLKVNEEIVRHSIIRAEEKIEGVPVEIEAVDVGEIKGAAGGES